MHFVGKLKRNAKEVRQNRISRLSLIIEEKGLTHVST